VRHYLPGLGRFISRVHLHEAVAMGRTTYEELRNVRASISAHSARRRRSRAIVFQNTRTATHKTTQPIWLTRRGSSFTSATNTPVAILQGTEQRSSNASDSWRISFGAGCLPEEARNAEPQ
jgi:hypothetical protein